MERTSTRSRHRNQPARAYDTGTTWQSLWYDYVTGFYPGLDNRAVMLDLDDTAPVKLTGPLTPTLTVYLTAQLHGPKSLRTHPQLQTLRTKQ